MPWPIRPLRAIANVDLGRQRSPEHAQGPHMVPYLRAANVIDGHLDLNDIKEMNFNPDEQQVFGLQAGDILVSEGSGSIRTVGASAVWRAEIPGRICFQNTLLRVRPRSTTTDPRFLAWWCRFAYADGLFASAASGANIFHLSAERLRSLPVRHPPLPIQTRIADFLDAETARIDAIIAKKRKVIELVQERSKSVVDRLFGAPVRYSQAGVPVGLGDHSMVRLGVVAAVRSGLTLDAARTLDDSAVVRAYLRVANVQDGYLDLSEIKDVAVPASWTSRFELRRGDVLMTEGGDPDKLGRGTVWQGELDHCLHQNHIFSVRPTSVILPEYLALVTRTTYARSYFEMIASKTTGIASTSSTKISSFRIPFMSIDYQREMVAEANVQRDRAAALQRGLSKQIELLQEHRQALITATVTGEIEVPGVSG